MRHSVRFLHAARVGGLGTALIAGLLACRQRDDARERALEEPPARRLVGAWDARFRADQPPDSERAGGRGGRSGEAQGTIALVEDGQATSCPDLPLALHAGTYDVDFRPLGFEVRDPGEPPTAAATTRTTLDGARSDDSVIVVLAPQSSGRAGTRAVVLRGRFDGDSIIGRWQAGGIAPFGTHGTFVLRRAR